MITPDTPCYSEIFTLDTYKLRTLDFRPDVIFDIGANVGVFTTFARERFPRALIVAVEPHPANFMALMQNAPLERTVLLQKALGTEHVWRYPDVRYDDDSHETTGETYISEGFGYKLPDIEGHPLKIVAIEGVMLDALVAEYVQPGQQFIVKIDCEGAENILFVHEPSIAAMREADYVTMELHPYFATRTLYKWAEGQVHESAEALATRVGALLENTHDCESDVPMFYARRKTK